MWILGLVPWRSVEPSVEASWVVADEEVWRGEADSMGAETYEEVVLALFYRYYSNWVEGDVCWLCVILQDPITLDHWVCTRHLELITKDNRSAKNKEVKFQYAFS